MKTIYQIFLILLIASFVLFMFASCTNSKSISKLHSCNENDETNTAIVLNKQIITKSDTVVVLNNETWTNEDDDDDDNDDNQ